jgi:hypothetical protein
LSPVKETNFYSSLHAGEELREKFDLMRREEAVRCHEALAALARGGRDIVSDPYIGPRRRACEVMFAPAMFDADAYGRVFAQAGSDMLCGEASVTYGPLPRQAIAQIAWQIPRLRIIFMTRDPFDRFWSELSMLGFAYGSDLRDVPQNIIHSAVTNSNYASMLRRWLSFFSREQILVADMSEVSTKPLELLGRVCRFLGIWDDERFFGQARQVVYGGKPRPTSLEVQAALIDRLGFIGTETRALGFSVPDNWQTEKQA